MGQTTHGDANPYLGVADKILACQARGCFDTPSQWRDPFWLCLRHAQIFDANRSSLVGQVERIRARRSAVLNIVDTLREIERRWQVRSDRRAEDRTRQQLREAELRGQSRYYVRRGVDYSYLPDNRRCQLPHPSGKVCGGKIKAYGMCEAHHRRYRRANRLGIYAANCGSTEDGVCDRQVRTRGMCSMHYERWRRRTGRKNRKGRNAKTQTTQPARP